MAVFYVLPSRPVVGEQLARILEIWLPGLDCSARSWPELAEGLSSLLYRQTDSYLVFREDLPMDDDLRDALRDGFGAEEGDEVVEVDLEGWPRENGERRWRIRYARAA